MIRTMAMKIGVKWILFLLFFTGCSFPLILPAQEIPGFSKVEMMSAMIKGVENQKELYAQFLPKPEDLGEGWVEPWGDHPKAKFKEEDDYWMSMDNKPGFSAIGTVFSFLKAIPPKKLEKVMDYFIKELNFLPRGSGEKLRKVIPGLSMERMNAASTLFAFRYILAPSLATQMEMMAGFSQFSSNFTRSMIAKAQQHAGSGEDAEKKIWLEGMRGFLKEFMKPVKGMNVKDIKKAIAEEFTSVERLVSIRYEKCDDWEALMSDQPDPARVHLGAVEVKLMIIDRDRMADRIDDLEPEEVQTLQAKVNSVFKNPLEAMMKVYEKSLTLTRSEDATDSESKARKREEERKQLEEIKQALESMKWRVYTRDFGDNCYVINNEAKIPLKGQGPKIHIAGFNAFLRNGNAVVTIGLAGNFKQEDFRKEMDHFLSEMDARTAFFRE